jgi:formylglycine-generating enzyme required for sulfatase activity
MEVRPFCLDRTEVSESSLRGYGTKRPATSVQWKEAAAFCKQLGGRLPSEAEWLFAATGGQDRAYPWGDEAPGCTRANSNACEGVTRPVDAPGDTTPEGVLGLAGNVSEWVSDNWRPRLEPGLAGAAGTRTVRGGSWNRSPSAASNTFRTGADFNESYRDGGIGFRCAYEPVVTQ